MLKWLASIMIFVSFYGLAEESPVADPQNLDELTTRLESLAAKHQVPGLQVALYDHAGVFWSKEIGFRDVQAKIPMGATTLMRAGSTTKSFVSLGVMQLVQQGKFSLNDNLKDLAPEVRFTNPWANSHPVKIIHLLEHTAGFDDMHFRNFYNVKEPAISLLDAINRDQGALRTRWQPGTRHAYSNPGYGILGYLIEKYSGLNYEIYLEHNILLPLGMTNSQFGYDKRIERDLSRGYVDGATTIHREIYLRSAGNLYSSALDLAKLGQFLLSRGASAQLANIDAQLIKSMESPSTTLAAKAGLSYGYGLGIYQQTRDHRVWTGHNGGIDGFITSYGYSPAMGKGYSLIVNTSSSEFRPFLTLITRFLAQNFPADKALNTGGIAETVAGYYRSGNLRNEIFAGIDFPLNVIKLVVDGEKLHIQPLLGTDETFIHMGGQKFRAQEESHASGIFIENDDGTKVIELQGQYFVKTNLLSAWLPMIILGFCLFTLLVFALYIPVWVTNLLRAKLSQPYRVRIRLLPTLAVISLLVAIFATTRLDLFAVGQFNWQTLTICIATFLFAIFSLFSFVQVIFYANREPNRLARLFNSATAVAITTLSVYAMYFNFIGLSLWRW